MDDIKENNKADISKILIGNKSDLEDKREVSREEAEKFAESIGCKYYECSAKTGENISDALDEIARITYFNVKDNKELINHDSIELEEEKEQKKKSCLLF